VEYSALPRSRENLPTVQEATDMFAKLSNTIWGSPSNTHDSEEYSYNNKVCGVCKEQLIKVKEPRYLSCNHAFCYECLKVSEINKSIRCKICSRATRVDRGTDSLRKMFQDDDWHEHVSDDSDDENPHLEPIEKLYPPLANPNASFVDVPLNKSQGSDDGSGGESEEKNSQELKEGEVEGFVSLTPSSVKVTPDSYLPLTQTAQLSKVRVENWLSKKWFVASDIKEKLQFLDFDPKFVPFYIFKISVETQYEATIPHISPDEVISERITRKSEHVYHDRFVCASYSVPLELVNMLANKPHSFSESSRFLPEVLDFNPSIKKDGQILTVDFDVNYAFDAIGGISKINELETQRCSQLVQNQFPNHENFFCTTQMKREHSVILLPIFFGGYIYEGKNFEVVVSGNRGVVAGKRPPLGTGALGKMVYDGWNYFSKIVKDTM